MDSGDRILNIRQDEEYLKTVRQFPLVYFWTFLIWFIIFLLPFFFFIPLSALWNRNGLYAGALAVFIAAIFIFRIIIQWYYTKIIITSKRIIGIHQKGLFDRTVSDTDFDRLIKVSFSVEGVIETLFNFGTLEIETFSEKQFPKMKVGSPEKIYNFISKDLGEQNAR